MTSRKEIARLEQLVRDGHLDRVEYIQDDKHYTVTRNAAGGVDTVAVPSEIASLFAVWDAAMGKLGLVWDETRKDYVPHA